MDGERRHLTVLVGELVNSVEILVGLICLSRKNECRGHQRVRAEIPK